MGDINHRACGIHLLERSAKRSHRSHRSHTRENAWRELAPAKVTKESLEALPRPPARRGSAPWAWPAGGRELPAAAQGPPLAFLCLPPTAAGRRRGGLSLGASRRRGPPRSRHPTARGGALAPEVPARQAGRAGDRLGRCPRGRPTGGRGQGVRGRAEEGVSPVSRGATRDQTPRTHRRGVLATGWVAQRPTTPRTSLRRLSHHRQLESKGLLCQQPRLSRSAMMALRGKHRARRRGASGSHRLTTPPRAAYHGQSP